MQYPPHFETRPPRALASAAQLSMALGLRENSHMIMQDSNNLQIAEFIDKWIDRNLRHGHKRHEDS